MKWARDLWSEPNEERVSHSRFLALAAFCVVSWVIVKQTIAGVDVSAELLLGYLTVMVLGEMGKGVSRHYRDSTIERERIRTKFTDHGVGEHD